MEGKMKASHKHKIILVCLIVLTLPALASTVSAASAPSSDRFQLVILKQDWYDLKLGYNYTEALPVLRSANAADRLFVIRTNDIESYRWTGQSIALTAEGTARLIQILPRVEDLKGPIRAMHKVKMEHGWGNPIETALHLKGFLAMADDRVIYGGIFLEPMSQMAIAYPVIRPGMVDGKAMLHLMPVQIPFVAYDPVSNEGAAWDRAIAPEGARDWVQFPEEMKSRFVSFGTRQEAIEFRQIIRNLNVREIMQQAGKLSQ
jgi:hypothetical protein